MAGASSATKKDASGLLRISTPSASFVHAPFACRIVPAASTTSTGTGSASKAFQKRSARGASDSSWPSTGCHGVHAASRSAETSMSPDAVSMTQALASDDTPGGSAVCCGTRMAIEAPSGDVRSAASVRSSASGPIEKSNSSTSCWRAMAAIASAFECITVVSTMSRRWLARMLCTRDVRSFVDETKRTLSPAAALSAAGSDQPKLPLSNPVSPKPLPVGAAGFAAGGAGGAGASATTGGGSGCVAPGTGVVTGAGVSIDGASTGGAGVSARFLCDFFSIVLPVGTGASATGAGGATSTGAGSTGASATGASSTGGSSTGAALSASASALARSRAATAAARASG